MQTVASPDPFDTPTRPINDGPALLRIRRLAALARERIETCPDEDSLATARHELRAIEALAAEALR